MSILLADDDSHLTNFLSKSFEEEGYSVHTATDEHSVFDELKRQNYRLIILDLNFGETDGIKLLEKLRSGGLLTPVLVLSARNRVSDRIQSLNLGADDYMTKPFSFQELSARANAILRRKADPSLNTLRVEDLEMDPLTRKVHRGQHEIRLSPKEFDMLHLLMRRAGETVSRQQLLSECWETTETDSNLVDVYVNYLRKKVDAQNNKLIHTVRGLGYRMGKAGSPEANAGNGDGEHQVPLAHRYLRQTFSTPSAETEEPASLACELAYSVSHDLAQPLTSVRCFLEMLAMRKSDGVSAEDMRIIEQQADRAIALSKGISVLVRHEPAAGEAWVSLQSLFNELLGDFSVLEHSGLFTIQRIFEPSIQVSSNPLLRQLLVLVICKLAGCNTRPVNLTIAAQAPNGRCHLDFRWSPAESSQKALTDGATILGRERETVKEILRALGGELVARDNECHLSITLPSGHAAIASTELIH